MIDMNHVEINQLYMFYAFLFIKIQLVAIKLKFIFFCKRMCFIYKMHKIKYDSISIDVLQNILTLGIRKIV